MGADTTCDKQEISCSAIVDALSKLSNSKLINSKVKIISDILSASRILLTTLSTSVGASIILTCIVHLSYN